MPPALDQSTPEAAIRSFLAAAANANVDAVKTMLESPNESQALLKGIQALKSMEGRIETSSLTLETLHNDGSVASVQVSERSRIVTGAGRVLRDWQTDDEIYNLIRRDDRWYIRLSDVRVTP